ncbi:hypothetical protein LDENG_00099670 [Lucifuga dentata]|nr:hypothetical protein LDENG_00099670 [Lucifuga dentata]
MDRALDGLDAAGFLQIWQHFDANDNGFIAEKDLDTFFKHTLEKLGTKRREITEEDVRKLKKGFLSANSSSADGRLRIQQLAAAMLPEEENFLLLFHRETPLDNSVEFMRIWRNYDADSSGYISSIELKGFLQDLFIQHRKSITPEKLQEYTDAMSCSQDDRRRDFEKIFAHYDVSKTGALEGPEVDGFVKDMMELVKSSISGTDLDRFRKALLGHCDINRDGKIQKNELALCLGLKLS